MTSDYQYWYSLYEDALLQLKITRCRFNYVDPDDKEAIDATIYSINSAEKLIASALRQLKQIEEEQLLCLA